MTIRLVASTAAASEAQLKADMGKVLAQLYSEGLSRVEEAKFRDHLTPEGYIMVKLTVEQWCTDD